MARRASDPIPLPGRPRYRPDAARLREIERQLEWAEVYLWAAGDVLPEDRVVAEITDRALGSVQMAREAIHSLAAPAR